MLIGMGSASFAIIFMKIKLEWHSIIFCNIGGIVGLVFGLEFIDPIPHSLVQVKCHLISTIAMSVCITFWTVTFRVTEKVATPTSVILMAVNTITGFFWRANMTNEGCEREAWLYLAAAVPISAICGPCGAMFASYTHRQVQAALIYILDTLALVRSVLTVLVSIEQIC
jgi:uncharacterized membrane protein YfcA